MTNIMTPSEPITSGQIGKFQDLLGAALRKSGLPSDATQKALEHGASGVVAAMVTAIRSAVEAVANLIVRHVSVNRTLTAKQALEATGRTQYVNQSVLAAMPKGEGTEVELFFLKLGRSISPADLEAEIDRLGFKLADPMALAKANQDDHAFADAHPNCTQWKDANGNYCFATFRRWLGKRHVGVSRHDHDWNDYWFFAVVRK